MNNALLFLPGPTQVLPEILERCSHPQESHRSENFFNLGNECRDLVKELLKIPEFEILLFSSSATGIMEGLGQNLLKKGEQALCLINGAFSKRQAESLEAFDYFVHRFESEPGQPFDLEKLESLLKTKPFRLLTVAHSETSTGILNDPKAIGQVIRKCSPNTFFALDMVSSAFGVECDMQSCGVDVAFFGLQKCLACPPGLAFATLSKRVTDFIKTNPGSGYYFNFSRNLKSWDSGKVPFTPAMSLYYPLHYQLKKIQAAGIDNRFQNHLQMAKSLRSILDRYFVSLPPLEHRSPSVTVYKSPPKFPFSEFKKGLTEKGYLIASGYGDLKDSTFRIGHMGDLTPEQTQKCALSAQEILSSKIKWQPLE